MFGWDSLRAHNGCLSLFDLNDLARGFGSLALKDSPGIRPKQYRIKRVPVGASGPEPDAPAKRVLLPSLQWWEDPKTIGRSVSEQAEIRQSAGIILLVKENSKIQVIRDHRTRDDLGAAFPDVDKAILDEVWSRTHMYTAACSILISLRNSGHHVRGDGQPADLNLEDKEAWPALFEQSQAASEGWEHVPMPVGEEWELVEDVDEDDEEARQEQEHTYGRAGTGGPLERGVVEDGRGHGHGQAVPSPRSYREALLANLMETGREWPVAPTRPPPYASTIPSVRGRFKKAKLKVVEFDDEDGYDGGNFVDEYMLEKAVAARTYANLGRKRLTVTGKARMAAKLSSRLGAVGDDEEAYGSGDDL